MGRSYIFLVGIYGNKMCEKYDIEKDEWTLLPTLPKGSLQSWAFTEGNQYLGTIITPFEINAN